LPACNTRIPTPATLGQPELHFPLPPPVDGVSGAAVRRPSKLRMLSISLSYWRQQGGSAMFRAKRYLAETAPMLEPPTRVTYFYLDPVGFSADNEMNLQNRRLALRLFFEQDRRSLNPLNRLKVRDYGSRSRNAGQHRVRPLPDRAASPRAPHDFQPNLPARRRDPHDCGEASYTSDCKDGRRGFRAARPRHRVGEILGLTAAHRLMK
jgi:hypothetical protein